jgi:hypothetical protein
MSAYVNVIGAAVIASTSAYLACARPYKKGASKALKVILLAYLVGVLGSMAFSTLLALQFGHLMWIYATVFYLSIWVVAVSALSILVFSIFPSLLPNGGTQSLLTTRSTSDNSDGPRR